MMNSAAKYGVYTPLHLWCSGNNLISAASRFLKQSAVNARKSCSFLNNIQARALAVIKISEKGMSLGVFPMSCFLNYISSVILIWRLNKLWPAMLLRIYWNHREGAGLFQNVNQGPPAESKMGIGLYYWKHDREMSYVFRATTNDNVSTYKTCKCVTLSETFSSQFKLRNFITFSIQSLAANSGCPLVRVKFRHP
jgi:hypothetical protein